MSKQGGHGGSGGGYSGGPRGYGGGTFLVTEAPEIDLDGFYGERPKLSWFQRLFMRKHPMPRVASGASMHGDHSSSGKSGGKSGGHGHHHHHHHHQQQQQDQQQPEDTGGGESDIGYEPPTYGAGSTGDPADLDGMSVGLLDPYGATGTAFGFGEEAMGGGADGDGDGDGGEPVFGSPFGADFGGEGPTFGSDLGTELGAEFGSDLGAEFGFGADEEENLDATPEEILGEDFEEAHNPPGAWDPSEQAPTLRNPVLEFGGELYSGFGPAAVIGCDSGPYGVKG
jgi:hypothetical protein